MDMRAEECRRLGYRLVKEQAHGSHCVAESLFIRTDCNYDANCITLCEYYFNKGLLLSLMAVTIVTHQEGVRLYSPLGSELWKA
jgi:hypothetical protein